MISKKIEESILGQITNEAFASRSYLAMASWCETEGFRGCASFLYAQAGEETEHMLKLIHYVNEAGGHARISAIKEPVNQYKSVQEVFYAALDQEKGVTVQINKLVEITLNVKDYASFNFLQWYVAEQHEEEKLFTTIKDMIKLVGTDNLLLIDKDIEKLRVEAK